MTTDTVSSENGNVSRAEVDAPRLSFLDRYGLLENPFVVAPNARFTYLTASTSEALEHCRHVVNGRLGLGAVTGEVGTGKTTLMGVLAQESYGAGHGVVVLDGPPGGMRQTESKFFTAIASDLGIKNVPSRSAEKALSLVREDAMKRHREERRTTVVFIDEAHKLKADTLELLKRLLSHAVPEAHLIQVLLFGQLPEFVVLLKGNRAIHSRLVMHTRLNPLTVNDVKHMVEFRLAQVSRKEPLFQMQAIEQLFIGSKGVPRDVCALAELACILGDAQQAPVITPALVRIATEKLMHQNGDADAP